jgi:ubiquinone/menaquinone biosynthesis C-methylase UbiE
MNLSWLYKIPVVQKTYSFHFVKVVEAKILLEFLGEPEKNDVVLDVACGVGRYSLQLANISKDVYGFDMDKRKVQIANRCKKPNNYFLVASAENLPFTPEFFDKVFCACSLEHFADDEKALREMAGALKNGGILSLSVDSLDKEAPIELRKWVEEKSSTVRFYSSQTLREKLAIAGFEVHFVKYYIKSSISKFLFYVSRTTNGAIFQILFPLFPLVCSLSILSDRRLGQDGKGYQLAMKAVKQRKPK